MLDTRDPAPNFLAQPRQRSHEPQPGRVPRESHKPHEPRTSGRAATPSNSAKPLDEFLRDARFDPNDPHALGAMLASLIGCGYDRAPSMPLPGHGQTLARWRSLAAVAACDLGLVKLFEGHTDALAILAELDGPPAPEASRWAVWAAEAPQARVRATACEAAADQTGIPTIGGERANAARVTRVHTQLRLTGTKAWCSGAQSVTHALVTAWLDDEPILAAVDMAQPSITIDTSNWQAVGMQATASADVHFDASVATLLGAPHAYVRRPGFWHGGAGIAACWYGAAAQIGRSLRDACAQRADPLRLAQLGATDIALQAAAAVLRETAAWIDAHPRDDAQTAALRARLAVEQAADTVMHHATRALGAGPLCRDARFARALADLPVFLRQSHAQRDLAALGEQLVAAAGSPRDARAAQAAQPPGQVSSSTDSQWTI
ncbi:acyl-CoA/acyl-ACP dehydrogenase [Paraburkholderia sp. MMS20-SJTR3]|uniref:Acyl-CoA/acyl-ACP dehydrogenase n=1 Tax=Paraburkholderia sejongensis TaxID=2886946 RepID=A0ABS8JNV1_9BURK|nr:acyl-CoA dehydrogenase family protein [Paraburkholderia sp. MMS20-SJTR3]MCC8391571.1 acyl-CoA/acyl-ACP dehydrogenase [Paraburkholderia sp. MMS20-SJTR3]